MFPISPTSRHLYSHPPVTPTTTPTILDNTSALHQVKNKPQCYDNINSLLTSWLTINYYYIKDLINMMVLLQCNEKNVNNKIVKNKETVVLFCPCFCLAISNFRLFWLFWVIYLLDRHEIWESFTHYFHYLARKTRSSLHVKACSTFVQAAILHDYCLHRVFSPTSSEDWHATVSACLSFSTQWITTTTGARCAKKKKKVCMCSSQSQLSLRELTHQ